MQTESTHDLNTLLLCLHAVSLAHVPKNGMGVGNELDKKLENLERGWLERFVSQFGWHEPEFIHWCYGHYLCSIYNQEAVVEKMKLSAVVSRSYGSVSASFGIEIEVSISSDAQRMAEFDRLLDAVNVEHGRFASKMGSSALQSDMIASGSNKTVITLDAIRLNVEVKSGKRYFKVAAGKWEKHGVNYWPETIKAGGVDPSSIPNAGYDLSGYKVDIEMDGEKPVRVVKLYKV